MELYSGNDSDETNEGVSAITSERQFWLRVIEVGFLTVPGCHFLPNRAAVPRTSLALQQRRPPSRELHTVGREYKPLFFYLRNLLTEET